MEREKLIEVIRHYDDMEIYADNFSDEVKELVTDKNGEIIAAVIAFLMRTDEFGVDYKTQKQIDQLQERIREIADDLGDEIVEKIQKQNDELIKTEMAFLLMLLAMTGQQDKKIPQYTVDNIKRYGRFIGQNVTNIFNKFKTDLVYNIMKDVTNGVDNNATMQDLRNIVSAVMEKAGNNAKLDTDLIVNGVINDVTMAVAEKNKAKLEYIAVMDDRTCSKCEGLHGHVYNYDDPSLPVLPQHHRCRCQLVPYTDSGLNEITFSDYFESLSENEKRERIGNKRYNSYKKGDFKVTKFVPPENLKKLLKEIQKSDRISFV